MIISLSPARHSMARWSSSWNQATRDKLDTFKHDSRELCKQMIMKDAEMMAVMRAASPDPSTAARISGELFDLQAAFDDLARKAGVAHIIGKPCDMGMIGPGSVPPPLSGPAPMAPEP